MIPRIPLSPGFHAEPPSSPNQLYRIYVENPHNRGHFLLIGSLNKIAVDAWANSAEAEELAKTAAPEIA